MQDKVRQFVDRRRLPIFLVSAVFVAAVLVIISVSVYYQSGAYQLDLSRPEYKAVRSQIEPDRKVADVFEAQGSVDVETLERFLDIYQGEADKALRADAYATDVLSNEQLGL